MIELYMNRKLCKRFAEEMRNKSIDALKTVCSFLIVCIHIPPKIMGGGGIG